LGFGQKGSGVIGLNENGFMVSRHAKLIAHYCVCERAIEKVKDENSYVSGAFH
jgi:hypothetical protein